MRSPLRTLHEALFRHYGPQGWWPGDGPFEVIVGAILTQNTNWRNVDRAIGRLRSADLMDPGALLAAGPGRVAERIRPAGTYRVKARRLFHFLEHLRARHGLSLERMTAAATGPLREELLSIPGIGPETADSILLYAFGRPVFVVDAYTRRILTRHGLAEAGEPYESLQGRFHASLPRRADLFNEAHALLVRVGKERCRPRPRCEGCPLEPWLGDAVGA